jgi:hypothetical protein
MAGGEVGSQFLNFFPQSTRSKSGPLLDLSHVTVKSQYDIKLGYGYFHKVSSHLRSNMKQIRVEGLEDEKDGTGSHNRWNQRFLFSFI